MTVKEYFDITSFYDCDHLTMIEVRGYDKDETPIHEYINFANFIKRYSDYNLIACKILNANRNFKDCIDLNVYVREEK